MESLPNRYHQKAGHLRPQSDSHLSRFLVERPWEKTGHNDYARVDYRVPLSRRIVRIALRPTSVPFSRRTNQKQHAAHQAPSAKHPIFSERHHLLAVTPLLPTAARLWPSVSSRRWTQATTYTLRFSCALPLRAPLDAAADCDDENTSSGTSPSKYAAGQRGCRTRSHSCDILSSSPSGAFSCCCERPR